MRMTFMPSENETAGISGAKQREPSTEIMEVKEAAIVAVPEAPAEKAAPKRAPRPAVKRKVSAEPAERLLFGKYSFKDVVVDDPSLANQITLNPKEFPATFGRRKDKVYFATHVNIVERLINKMMSGGTGKKIGGKVIRTKGALQGKKLKVTHVVESAFETISKRTGKNPLQVFVNALENAPR